jgi:histidinol-phosphate aminotransferase
MNIESLIRKNIRALEPYHSARQDYISGVLLDANENAFGSVLTKGNLPLNRYPDPYQREVRTVLSAVNDIALENIFVGVGSDEVIDLLIRVFCEPRSDSIVVIEPTYGMYRVSASIQDAEVRACSLTKDFQIDIVATARMVDSSTKIIFCCSPNNPTANLLRTDDILELCKLGVIVVVDEAYIDFAKTESIAKHISEYPNLVVLRTLSKAWGLAGIRFGYCIADATIVSYLMKIKPPYNINALTSRTTLQALSRGDELRKMVDIIIKEREWLSNELADLLCVRHVFPSVTNFILIQSTDATALHKILAGKNIIIRNRSSEPLLKNCLRITVGTHKENEMLIQTVKEYYE